jgi:type IV secretory pathway TrbL component
VVVFAAVVVFLAVVFFATVFSVAVSDFTAAVLVGFLDLLLVFPLQQQAGLYGQESRSHIWPFCWLRIF